MHYRQGKVKREHSIIKDVLPLLMKVSAVKEISTIVPGRIKPIVGNYPEPVLEFKVKTDSGIKCIVKSSRSVQEVFIVTDDTEIVLSKLRVLKFLK